MSSCLQEDDMVTKEKLKAHEELEAKVSELDAEAARDDQLRLRFLGRGW